MNIRLAVFPAVLLCMSCDQPAQTKASSELPADSGQPSAAQTDSIPPSTQPNAATAQGWGALTVGMTRAQVVAAVGDPASVTAPIPGSSCEEFHPSKAPAGMLVMIEQGRLTRLTLTEPSTLTTDRGFKVGDPADVVKKAYGSQAQVTPHKYSDAPAEYITVWTVRPPEPDPRGIVYEIGTQGSVERIHVGGPSIQYVEGCS